MVTSLNLRQSRSLTHYLAGIVTALAVFFVSLGDITERRPVHDELFYLATGWNLARHQTFGQHGDHRIAPPPGGVGVPLYPALLGLAMIVDDRFARAVDCLLQKRPVSEACTAGFRRVFVAQLVLMSVGLGGLVVVLAAMFSSVSLALLTVVLITASGAPAYFAGFFLTEAVYLPLVFFAMTAWARCSEQPRNRLLLVTAVLFGLLALTRPSFYYLYLLLVPCFVVVRWRAGAIRWRIAAQCLLLLLAFYATVGPWMWRNYVLFDRAAVTVGYGGRAFSTRLAYNDMTLREYAAGWVYWLPDFGDKLGLALFGNATVAPLDLGNPEGYYLAGTERVGKAAAAATGYDPNALATVRGDPALAWMLRKAVVEQPLVHGAVTALLAWRGAFVQKYFGLLGVIALLTYAMFNRRAIDRQRVALLAVPPLLLLIFNAGVSLNIPRYNLPLLLPMALVMSAYVVQTARSLTTQVGYRE